MPHADFYERGGFNAACSMCGRKYKASQLRRHWQGLYRCMKCWEPRNSQDFVKAGPPEEPPPWIQPWTDTDLPQCSIWGISSIPGYAMPGCSLPSFLLAI